MVWGLGSGVSVLAHGDRGRKKNESFLFLFSYLHTGDAMRAHASTPARDTMHMCHGSWGAQYTKSPQTSTSGQPQRAGPEPMLRRCVAASCATSSPPTPATSCTTSICCSIFIRPTTYELYDKHLLLARFGELAGAGLPGSGVYYIHMHQMYSRLGISSWHGNQDKHRNPRHLCIYLFRVEHTLIFLQNHQNNYHSALRLFESICCVRNCFVCISRARGNMDILH